MRNNSFLFVVVTSALLLTASLKACENCCGHCGIVEAEATICRLVCVEKKITVTCWTCESEDFCLSGPNKLTCRHYDCACEDPSQCNGLCHRPRNKMFVWGEWAPGGSPKLFTKKKLMKKTVTKNVPSYKWVVEDLCAQCEANCTTVAVPEGTKLPPVPPGDHQKVLGGYTPPPPR